MRSLLTTLLALTLSATALHAQSAPASPPRQWKTVERVPAGSQIQVVDTDTLRTVCRIAWVTDDALACTPETDGTATRITFPRDHIALVWLFEQDYGTSEGKKALIGALLGGAAGIAIGAKSGAGVAAAFGALGAGAGITAATQPSPFPQPPHLHIHRHLLYRAPSPH